VLRLEDSKEGKKRKGDENKETLNQPSMNWSFATLRGKERSFLRMADEMISPWPQAEPRYIVSCAVK
jgi:hypothetical protein